MKLGSVHLVGVMLCFTSLLAAGILTISSRSWSAGAEGLRRVSNSVVNRADEGSAMERITREKLSASQTVTAIRLRGRSEIRRGDRQPEFRRFEIVLEGPDHYYRREWKGEKGKDGWGSSEQLILPEFECRWGETVSIGGYRGAGNYSKVNHTLMPAVARRLWPEKGKTGVDKHGLIHADEQYREEFQDLKVYRGIEVPGRIVWKD